MRHLPRYNQIAGQNPARIEALSDGVFSIAMTLLVLDLKVPVQTLVHSEEQLMEALIKLGPSFLSYALGFITLGIFWVGQSTQFSFIQQSNRSFAWLHLFFLAWVGLLPFTTAFLNAYIEYRLAVGVYWLNILFGGIGLYSTFRYALRHKLTTLTEADGPIKQAILSRIIRAQAFYAAGAALCFVDTYLSITVILLVQLNYAFGLTSNR